MITPWKLKPNVSYWIGKSGSNLIVCTFAMFFSFNVSQFLRQRSTLFQRLLFTRSSVSWCIIFSNLGLLTCPPGKSMANKRGRGATLDCSTKGKTMWRASCNFPLTERPDHTGEHSKEDTKRHCGEAGAFERKADCGSSRKAGSYTCRDPMKCEYVFTKEKRIPAKWLIVCLDLTDLFLPPAPSPRTIALTISLCCNS